MASANENSQLTPAFIVYVNGKRFSAEQEGDVKEIIVSERIDVPTAFSIVMSDPDRKWTDHDDFSEGSSVEIMMGYKDDVQKVMEGEITGISPLYRMNADDIVMINGNSLMHRLHRGKKTRTFSNMTYSDIVDQMAGDAGMGSDVDDLGSANLFLIQRNLTDYEYLMQIASMYNCKAWVSDGNLNFKRIDESGEDAVVEWGKTLIDFRPRLDAVGLVSKVKVMGWDQSGASSVSASAATSDISVQIGGDRLGCDIAKSSYGSAEMVIIDNNVVDQSSAESVAKDAINDNSLGYFHGTGKCQGNYKIKMGSMIDLKGVGTRFSGKYYVKEMKHFFRANEGFTTTFEVIRNAV